MTGSGKKSGAGRGVLIFMLLSGWLVFLWQYWSWGPYTIQIANVGTSTRDFVVECIYGMKGMHAVEMVHRETYVLGSGDTAKCPRRFLGPTGTGLSALLYHPLYQQQVLHRQKKYGAAAVVLNPAPFDEAMADQATQAAQRRILARHMGMLESHYLPAFALPAFALSERQTLADNYVARLQDYVRLAGGLYGYRSTYDQKTLDYIDEKFRKP